MWDVNQSGASALSKFTDGDRCAICNKPWVAGVLFANHHVQHIPTEITVIVCNSCHSWMHGRNTWPYSLKPRLPKKKKDRTPELKQAVAVAPVKFARKVVSVYRRALK